MTVEILQKVLKFSPKVYVWVPLNDTTGVYLEVSKVTLQEYLSSSEEHDIAGHLDDDMNLFVGLPYED